MGEIVEPFRLNLCQEAHKEYSTSLVIKQMEIQTVMRYHEISIRTETILTLLKNQRPMQFEEISHSHTADGNAKGFLGELGKLYMGISLLFLKTVCETTTTN